MNHSKFFQQNLRTSYSFHNLVDQDAIRQPPQKIRQNKFTKTFSKLQYIPLQIHIPSLKPRYINHLYLSHNNIKYLKGIQQYTQLQSLNISYNNFSDIEQLNLIKCKQKIKHLGLKMNNFIYGYQDYAIGKFKNLEKLDDLDVRDKQYIKFVVSKADNIANYFIEYHLRMKRILTFMDDMMDKKAIHTQLKAHNHNFQSNDSHSQNIKFQNNRKKLKLLTQNMSQQFIAKVSALYSIPSQQEFRKISTKEILQKIQQAIQQSLAQNVDLKCNCRPRLPLHQEIKENYKQICQSFLLQYSNRFNKDLLKVLKRLQTNMKLKYPYKTFENYELFGMLQNYQSLSSGGKKYADITQHNADQYLNLNQIQMNQKQKQSQKQKKLLKHFLQHQFNQQIDKQNISPNVQINHNENKKNQTLKQYQPVQQFNERIPIIVFQKNFIQVLMIITMELIGQMLMKYDYLTQNRKDLKVLFSQQPLHKFSGSSVENKLIKSNSNHLNYINSMEPDNIVYSNAKDGKINMKSFSNRQTPTVQTARNQTAKFYDNKNKIFDTQAMLRSTVVNNSPNDFEKQNLQNSNHVKTTPRPFSMLTRKDSEISFGGNKQIENEDKYQNYDHKQVQVSQSNNRLTIHKNSYLSNENYSKRQYNEIKYTIYKINLIYKTFRGLKQRVFKRRRKEKKKMTKVPHEQIGKIIKSQYY